MSLGKYIVFEGIDGSGKGTQIRLAKDYLISSGISVVDGKEPGGTELGVILRKTMFFDIKTQNMAENVVDCLLLADHIQHMEKLVKPAIASGSTVLADRSAYSQYAYSVDRVVHPYLRQAYHELEGVRPDVLFLLTGTPELLLERAQKRTTETHQAGKAWNKVDSQRRIQNEYLRLLADESNVVVIDTDDRTPEDIFNNSVLPVLVSVLLLEAKAA